MDIVTYALCKKYTQEQIASLGEIFSIKGSVTSVDDLPTDAAAGDLYFVDNDSSEYVYTDAGTWEQIGPVFDTSDLMQKGVDYVTAGRKANSTLGTKATAEGRDTVAAGAQSHAEGLQTIANGNNQHVFGQFNVADNSNTYIEIAGKGNANNDRSNARTLDWNGNEVLAGKLTVGAAPTNPMDVATKQYVDSHSGGSGSSYIIHFDEWVEAEQAYKSVETVEEVTAVAQTNEPIFGLLQYGEGEATLIPFISDFGDDYCYLITPAQISPSQPGFSSHVSSFGDIWEGEDGYFYLGNLSNITVPAVLPNNTPTRAENSTLQATIMTINWGKYDRISNLTYPNLLLKINDTSQPIGTVTRLIIDNSTNSNNLLVQFDGTSTLTGLLFSSGQDNVIIKANSYATGTITYFGNGIAGADFAIFNQPEK